MVALVSEGMRSATVAVPVDAPMANNNRKEARSTAAELSAVVQPCGGGGGAGGLQRLRWSRRHRTDLDY